MVKSLTALIIALPVVLSAAVSPLTSVSDYIFTRPLATNLIKGVVIGPNGSYRSIRYEDMAFLREAIEERDWLSRASVSSNELYRAMTNAAFTSVQMTNGTAVAAYRNEITFPHREYENVLNEYIDPSVELSTGMKLVNTNRFEYESWGQLTNYFQAVTNFITMAMTNGHVSVWTNVVSSFRTNDFVKIAYTNAPTVNDFMTEGGFMKTMFIASDFNIDDNKTISLPNAIPERSESSKFTPRHRTPVLSDMTNIYSTVDRMTRVMPKAYSAGGTNNFSLFKCIRNIYGNSYTNREIGTYYSARGEHGYTTSEKQHEDNDGWYNTQAPTNWTETSLVVTTPIPGIRRFTTSITKEIQTVGNKSRIESADVFILSMIEYKKNLFSSYSTTRGSDTTVDTNIVKLASVMLPYGRTVASDDGTNIVFDVALSNLGIDEIVSFADIPVVNEEWETQLPAVDSADWHYTNISYGNDGEIIDLGYDREKKTIQYVSEELKVSFDFYLIFNLTPKTTIGEPTNE